MNEEEKKAIEIIKGITEDDLLNYWEGPEEPYNAIQTILNLIEKQQKELNQEKEKNKELTEKYLKLNSDRFWNNVISKSKIREKIEELEKFIYTGENALQDFLQYRVKAKIQILQELLEE